MLHKCANPPCPRLFRKMTEGRLFQLPHWHRDDLARAVATHAPEYFWLCDECKLYLTLTFDPDSGVVVVPRARFPLSRRELAYGGELTVVPRVKSVTEEFRWNL